MGRSIPFVREPRFHTAIELHNLNACRWFTRNRHFSVFLQPSFHYLRGLHGQPHFVTGYQAGEYLFVALPLWQCRLIAALATNYLIFISPNVWGFAQVGPLHYVFPEPRLIR